MLEEIPGAGFCCKFDDEDRPGIRPLEELLAQEGNFGNRILELDYDIYAEGQLWPGDNQTSILEKK